LAGAVEQMQFPVEPRTTEQADLSVEGLLLDVDKFASHDGPGIRTTVFLKGCPLSCIWCHSPESRLNHAELIYHPDRCQGCLVCTEVCPKDALHIAGGAGSQSITIDRSQCDVCGKCIEVCYHGALRVAGRTVTVGEVVKEVRKDIAYFQASGGGVTLSGGEPARQPAFSYNFLMACQAEGIHTAVETTGYARWQVMEALAHVTDLFLYDLKFADAAAHKLYTGVDNRIIFENLQRLVQMGCEIHVRVPCISGVNDSQEQIDAIARAVADLGLSKIVLLPYNSAAGAKYEWLGYDFALPYAKTQSDEKMKALADICRRSGLTVSIGG
jgi:pyruvate formate lyase activating enzyme